MKNLADKVIPDVKGDINALKSAQSDFDAKLNKIEAEKESISKINDTIAHFVSKMNQLEASCTGQSSSTSVNQDLSIQNAGLLFNKLKIAK